MAADTALSPDVPRQPAIDAVRGITIVAMIFVNDLAPLASAPWWLKHYYPYDASGMTVADWVFPSFLFIVGMAIPLALGKRRARGEPAWRVAQHVGLRVLRLLALGVLMVNRPANHEAMGLPPGLWTAVMLGAAIVVWHRPPATPGRARAIGWAARAVAGAVLLVMVWVYRGPAGPDGEPAWLRTQWWGILGLIGWAYLTGAVLWAVAGRRWWAHALGAAALLGLWVVDRGGHLANWPGRGWVDFGSMIGGHGGIVALGMALSAAVVQSPRLLGGEATRRRRLAFGLLFGGALIAAGLLLVPAYGMNKNDATPAWCLICAGLTAWLWAACEAWLPAGDRPGWLGQWAARCGEHPLLAYLLHPVLMMSLWAAGVTAYAELGELHPVVGVVRSLVMAVAVTLAAAQLGRAGLRLRL